MKKYILLFLFTINSFAACDFSTGITKLPNGNFEYTKECHLSVGVMVKNLEDREAQVTALNKTIELKDLAIDMQEKRSALWMDTSFKLETKLNDIQRYNDTSNILHFALGVAVTGLSVWAAGQLK